MVLDVLSLLFRLWVVPGRIFQLLAWEDMSMMISTISERPLTVNIDVVVMGSSLPRAAGGGARLGEDGLVDRASAG